MTFSKAVQACSSMMQVIEMLGLSKSGGSHNHYSRRVKKLGLDTSHFTGQGHMKGKYSLNRKSPAEIFTILPASAAKTKSSQLKRALLEVGIEYCCEQCGLGDEWNGKPINLEIDHIDGNWHNNLQGNLRFVCPNCHSQQITTNMPHKYLKK